MRVIIPYDIRFTHTILSTFKLNFHFQPQLRRQWHRRNRRRQANRMTAILTRFQNTPSRLAPRPARTTARARQCRCTTWSTTLLLSSNVVIIKRR